jgi:hypothetical protein
LFILKNRGRFLSRFEVAKFVASFELESFKLEINLRTKEVTYKLQTVNFAISRLELDLRTGLWCSKGGS